MGLSNLGIFHTVIGVVAIVAPLIAFVQYGRIDLRQLIIGFEKLPNK